jgi:glutamine amidotransferase
VTSPHMHSVAVIDYGMGNLHSVAKALEHVAPNAIVNVTSDPAVIHAADRVVFPGVGAIRDCMAEIRRLDIDALVREAVQQKPVLAICVGMQALMAHSEENNGVECINLLAGDVKFFGADLHDANGERLKVPHMGWNEVVQTAEHPLWGGIPQNSRFYFVHSYYVAAKNRSLVAANCSYGVIFDAALMDKNLFAVQFHPEKSHTAGLQLLKNFMNWNGSC